MKAGVKEPVSPWLEVITALKSDIETNSRITVSRHSTHAHTHVST